MLRIKHLCQSCQTKFYNSNDSAITCPACGVTISEIVVNLKEKIPAIIEDEDYLREEADEQNELYILNEDY